MTIPIVQGTLISAAQEEPQSGYYQQQQKPGGFSNLPQSDEGDAIVLSPTNDPPRRQYQDVVWAILYVVHLIVMLVVIGVGLSSVQISSDSPYGEIIFLVSVSGLASVMLSTAALTFMMRNAKILVQTALFFSVGTSLGVAILGFCIQSVLMGVTGLLSFLIGCCYAKLVWPRIPFAAANLNTALTAVKANLGLAAIAYVFMGLAFGWTVVWMLGLGQSLSDQQLIIVFLLFVSYYWVHQVLQNTVHCTTAGVVGTWWFVPEEASTCCSPALGDSLYRACTFSFGSICFGSLLVAIVKALRALEYYSRNNDDLQFVSCIVQCILACLESILEELNQFAYVYVGLYGFSFLEAGRNVMQLFQNKGWTAIITDDLADNVLFMMSLAIGLATGLIGMVFGLLDSGMFEQLGVGHAAGGGFLIGFLTGYLFASVLLSIVGSAVNTVIVLFAEAPAEFERNHQRLSEDMRASWTQAWPELF